MCGCLEKNEGKIMFIAWERNLPQYTLASVTVCGGEEKVWCAIFNSSDVVLIVHSSFHSDMDVITNFILLQYFTCFVLLLLCLTLC